MFERFTDRARRVVVLAQEEARALDHNYIGTEHLLLGLTHEGEGLAAQALDALGVSLEAVRRRVEELIGRGQIPPAGHVPFTPRAKKVLEFALRESTQLGHNYIGTEHILLGLIREGEGVGAQVLVQLGADLNKVRQQVVQIMSGYEGAGRGDPRTVTSRVGPWVGAAPAVDPERMPLCPGCRNSLAGHLGSRVLEIGGAPGSLFVVYCTACGVALETRIEEPGA